MLVELTADPDDEDRGWETEPKQPNPSPQREPQLSPQQLRHLDTLLGQFPGVFSTIPGRTRVMQNVIESLPGAVIRAPWRPIPHKGWAAVEKEVTEILRLGVTEPSRSGWRSPIVLVPKPDGSIRFCIDFRSVNAQAKFDAYPMPRTDVLLDQLGEA